jgi:exodeoxyribonuclease VII small subunit
MTEELKKEIQAMDFETAFAALQENIAMLEGEELPLETALEVYERGQLLAQRCAALLESAELKVQQLSQDSNASDTAEG